MPNVISYAQNGEDVLLARVFRNRTDGFYVDIGAGHPTYESVTKHFYDLGWHGINVEPLSREFGLLCADRPRDVNVHAAISDVCGEAVVFGGPDENRGASTIHPEIARSYEASGQYFTPEPVATMTLGALFEQSGVSQVDFLKVDVEGHEAVIVNDFDWSTLSLRVLIVEATAPNSQRRSHEDWEPTLIAAGYQCAIFDGLNRFYVRGDDEEALELLSVPANVFDNAEPWRWVSQLRAGEAHARALERRLNDPFVRVATRLSNAVRRRQSSVHDSERMR